MAAAKTVDDYLAALPEEVRPVLHEVRRTLHAAVPGAGETISYGIPALTSGGRAVVYFAGWKHHISVYPVPDTAGDAALEAELTPYRAGRGTLKFPLNHPVPLPLLARVAARLLEQRTHRPEDAD
ncbi:iron chaperone [Streptomyces globosus]|uniref:iron chaperone n=1 Tax=Streptomyces globosus TaxID=68209 RepID=UPI0031DFC6D4